MNANGVDMEAGLLAGLLLRRDAFFELPAAFTSVAFADPTFRKSFEAIGRLARAGKAVTVECVAEEAGLTPEAGRKLFELYGAYDAEPLQYAAHLLERMKRHRLKLALSAAIERLSDHAIPLGDAIGPVVAACLSESGTDDPETVTLHDAEKAFLDDADRTKHGTQVRTGFKSIDKIVKLQRGNVVVVAADTGAGKTTLALNIAENVARAGGRVLVHSLEMNSTELASKILARSASVRADRLISDEPLESDEWGRIALGIDAHRGLPIVLNTKRYALHEIVRITEREHRRDPLALVVVDYLQLVDHDAGKGASDEARIGGVSRALRTLAGRLEVPLLAVAQFNREYQKRATGRDEDGNPRPILPPRLSDLRGSGRIAQDASSVCFLHNPYAESTDPQKRSCGPYEFTVAKGRFSPKHTTAFLDADLAFARFLERT